MDTLRGASRMILYQDEPASASGLPARGREAGVRRPICVWVRVPIRISTGRKPTKPVLWEDAGRGKREAGGQRPEVGESRFTFRGAKPDGLRTGSYDSRPSALGHVPLWIMPRVALRIETVLPLRREAAKKARKTHQASFVGGCGERAERRGRRSGARGQGRTGVRARSDNRRRWRQDRAARLSRSDMSDTQPSSTTKWPCTIMGLRNATEGVPYRFLASHARGRRIRSVRSGVG